jgi:hypothetical protein
MYNMHSLAFEIKITASREQVGKLFEAAAAAPREMRRAAARLRVRNYTAAHTIKLIPTPRRHSENRIEL